jgi:DNA mismatch repair protein MutS
MLFSTDKQTIEDLNIFGRQGKDSVFTLFNRTRTVKGAELLEEQLRYPLSDAEQINRRSGMIRYLVAVKAVFPFSAALFDMAELYLGNTDQRSRLPEEKPGVEKRLSGLIAGDQELRVIQHGIKALTGIIHQLYELLTGILSASGSPFRNDEETVLLLSLLETGAFKLLLGTDPDGKLSYESLVLYDKLLRFQDIASVKNVLRYIAQLDVYMAVALVARERGFIFPFAHAKGELITSIEGFYHPLLKEAVGNTLEITPKNNAIFLTGANMAGKSTFMKSLGIAMYLAHAGFPVAATKMEFSVMDGIYTTINLPDDLGMGASHFYAEVLRVKKVAKELHQDKKLFVIFDELFRGTNVKDAYEATIAITAAFAGKRDSIFVVSTHIIEAGTVLKKQCDNISFRYLPTTMQGNVPQYSYTLEEGITADRHGMVIITNEGILDILKKGKQKQGIS